MEEVKKKKKEQCTGSSSGRGRDGSTVAYGRKCKVLMHSGRISGAETLAASISAEFDFSDERVGGRVPVPCAPAGIYNR